MQQLQCSVFALTLLFMFVINTGPAEGVGALRPGDNCTSTTSGCIENAECSATPNTCVCKPHYYELSNRTCHKKIDVPTPCSLANTNDNPCVHGAICHNGICKCVRTNHHFDKGQEACVEHQSGVGDRCDPNQSTCPDHSTCTNTAGENHCLCISTFYMIGKSCLKRLDLDHPCDMQIENQCKDGFNCKNYRCVCPNWQFKHGSTCEDLKYQNEACDISHTDTKQCQGDTMCIIPRGGSDPKCDCDEDHYYSNKKCLERVHALRPCNFTLNSDTQCVESAKCNMASSLCECKDQHYFRSGRCVKRIAKGELCDPFTNYFRQCTGDLTCIDGACSEPPSTNGMVG